MEFNPEQKIRYKKLELEQQQLNQFSAEQKIELRKIDLEKLKLVNAQLPYQLKTKKAEIRLYIFGGIILFVPIVLLVCVLFVVLIPAYPFALIAFLRYKKLKFKAFQIKEKRNK